MTCLLELANEYGKKNCEGKDRCKGERNGEFKNNMETTTTKKPNGNPRTEKISEIKFITWD